MTRLPRLFRRPQRTPEPLFTDAQIAERAHTLWQARQASGKAGTETDDWEAAKASLLVEQSLPQRLRSLWSPAQVTEAQKTALELHKLQLERWKVWIAGFGVLATVLAGVGLYLTYRTGQEQQQLNTERLVTERFAKAVEQLGNGTIDVRIGAIYSLERIAKDSPKDHWTIMEVLTAFVRNKSPLTEDKKQKLKPVTTDVQSALTVIGRRKVENNLQQFTVIKIGPSYEGLTLVKRLSLDLSYTNLRGADLMGANLKGAKLSNANLEGAVLFGADLNYSHLDRASLRGADLTGAYLKGAYLKGAFGLTTAQVQAANNWEKANYSPDFRQQLGLPPEVPKPPLKTKP